jgi:3-deoxy-D-manno-octulosonate 8-phosphate phosphatase KdsC-like HAD superfamily phosphatase
MYRTMNRILTIIILGLLLAGCSIGEKRIKMFSVEEPRAKLNLQKPTPLQMEEIRWIIITSKNADEVFKKLEAQGIDPVLFGLTDKQYELLSKNFAQIRAKLKESNDILDKYKQYYEADNKANSKEK